MIVATRWVCLKFYKPRVLFIISSFLWILWQKEHLPHWPDLHYWYIPMVLCFLLRYPEGGLASLVLAGVVNSSLSATLRLIRFF